MQANTNFNGIKPGFQYVSREEISLPGVRRITLAGDPGCTGFRDESRFILAHILRQKCDAIFMLGDLACTGAEEEFLDVIDFCNCRVQVPIFALCGNHDRPQYKSFLGLSSYTVVADNFAIIFLDNSSGYCTDQEIGFLKKTLERHRTSNIILAMHVPPPTEIERSHLMNVDWQKIKAVLDPHRRNIRQIFSAHIHGFHQYEIDGYPVTITAGGGGAMIHDLKLPAQKIHHSISLDLHEDGRISSEVIKISGFTSPYNAYKHFE